MSIRSWSAGQLQAMINFFFDLLVLSLYNEIPLAWKNLYFIYLGHGCFQDINVMVIPIQQNFLQLAVVC